LPLLWESIRVHDDIARDFGDRLVQAGKATSLAAEQALNILNHASDFFPRSAAKNDADPVPVPADSIASPDAFGNDPTEKHHHFGIPSPIRAINQFENHDANRAPSTVRTGSDP
jgi:zona occludens toxin (predicted ATPase)